jgi:hypothetical protein
VNDIIILNRLVVRVHACVRTQDGLWRGVFVRWFNDWTWDSSRMKRNQRTRVKGCLWKDFFLNNCFMERTQGYCILCTLASSPRLSLSLSLTHAPSVRRVADWG